MLPRPVGFDRPVAQYVPQAGGRRYRDMIPNNLGRNATRDTANQTEYVDADGRVDDNIPQNTGRVNLFSALLPRNIFQTNRRTPTPPRPAPEYIELNNDILDAETVTGSIPGTVSTMAEEEEEDNVSVRSEVGRINNKYVTDGKNFMMHVFRPHLIALSGPQTHRNTAANTLINHRIMNIDPEHREDYVKGLNEGNERGSLWKVYYENGRYKYDGGPGGGRIKGAMGS